jgi:hypothetical protein
LFWYLAKLKMYPNSTINCELNYRFALNFNISAWRALEKT